MEIIMDNDQNVFLEFIKFQHAIDGAKLPDETLQWSCRLCDMDISDSIVLPEM